MPTQLTTKLSAGSLIFAPMEGVTHPLYRKVIETLYPEWDFLCADFLRIPSQQCYPLKHIRKHFGKDQLSDEKVKAKTILQILGPFHAYFQPTLEQLSELEIDWIDLNLGCPANTVNKRGGGSALLQDRLQLEKLLTSIRKNYSGIFTVKTRLGYESEEGFEDLIKMYEQVGVDAITIHARTKRDQYQGQAKWDYIAKAVNLVKVPIIGNGDLWTAQDVKRMFEQTQCHSVMCARGALMNPWLARDYKAPEKQVSAEKRLMEIEKYFQQLEKVLVSEIDDEKKRYRFYKGLSRYIFDPLSNGVELKKKVLQAQSLDLFWSLLADHCLQ